MCVESKWAIYNYRDLQAFNLVVRLINERSNAAWRRTPRAVTTHVIDSTMPSQWIGYYRFNTAELATIKVKESARGIQRGQVRRGHNIFSHDNILLPLCEQNHWWIIWVDVVNRRMEIFDSYIDYTTEEPRNMMVMPCLTALVEIGRLDGVEGVADWPCEVVADRERVSAIKQALFVYRGCNK